MLTANCGQIDSPGVFIHVGTGIRYNKFLSLILRHKPKKIGLHLDALGWTNVEELLAKAKAHGVRLTRPRLEQIVVTNDKQRPAFSTDGQRLRASQGHLLWVNRGLDPQTPTPPHGTATRFLDSIGQPGVVGPRPRLRPSLCRRRNGRSGWSATWATRRFDCPNREHASDWSFFLLLGQCGVVVNQIAFPDTREWPF